MATGSELSRLKAAGQPARLFPSTETALTVLADLKEEVANSKSFDRIDDISRMTKAIQDAYRDCKEVSDSAGIVRIDAEIRLRQELDKIPRAKGTQGAGRPKIGSTKSELPKDASPTLEQIGVARKRAAQAVKLVEIGKAKLTKIFTALSDADKTISPNSVLQFLRKEVKTEKKFALATAAFSEVGPFGTVVIDPPWAMEKIDREWYPNQDAFDYPTMSTDEIVNFIDTNLKSKLEPDCHLFMWTTQKWLPAVFPMLDRIGFKYVLVMVWHKSGGFQPVEMPQYNCEFVVYARRGSPIFIDTKDFPCCFDGARREHSRKPDRFYEIIRRVTGGSRIDVFSREAREGFAQYGNEIGKFSGRAGVQL